MPHTYNTFGRPALQFALPILLAVLLGFFATGSARAEVRNKIRCDITQIPLEDCNNGIRADFDDGRHTWSFSVAGPIAFAEKMETYLAEPVAVYIVDYPTRDEENRRMVDVEEAWFLYDAKGDESINQKPHIYGFRKREEAVEAQKELGGELQRWDLVGEAVFKFAEDWDRHARHGITNLRKGKR
jgi:hypothetical protein